MSDELLVGHVVVSGVDQALDGVVVVVLVVGVGHCVYQVSHVISDGHQGQLEPRAVINMQTFV